MNKTPIERLKAMLKERGVGYKDEMVSEDSTAISWRHDDDYATFCEHSDGTCTLIFDADNVTPEQAIAATLGSEREKELVRAMEDVLRHSTDTVWVGEAETLVDRMVSLGVYGCEVYEGARPWEVDE